MNTALNGSCCGSNLCKIFFLHPPIESRGKRQSKIGLSWVRKKNFFVKITYQVNVFKETSLID